MAVAVRQLLAYRFGSESRFEGQLIGALERIEAGGAIRVRDALFVGRDQAGELTAVRLSGGTGGVIAALLDFRLDPGHRRSATERALDGSGAELVRALADRLAAGEAVAAVIVEHAWAQALGEAVARAGGGELSGGLGLVSQDRLDELSDRLLDAVGAQQPISGAGPATE